MTKQYNTENIARLLGRFMAGESTLAEEQLLADYFRTHEVVGNWREYKEMFALFDSGVVAVRQEAPQQQHRASTPLRHGQLGWGVGIAAAVLIAFLLWPESDSPLPTSPKGEESSSLRERAVAEATQQLTMEVATAQPQQEARSNAQPKRKRKKAVPKPVVEPQQEAVPDEPPANAETEASMDLYEASYRPPREEMMTVEELRARGNRLTENIRQQLQANNVPF